MLKFKYVRILVVVCLLTYQCFWPGVSWAATITGSLFPQSNDFYDSFQIPAEFGSVEKMGDASKPTIIHILTAHGNYEAEKHIEAILGYLQKSKKIDSLLVEGSANHLDSSRLVLIPEQPELNQKVLEELSKQSMVKGAELFLLQHPQTSAWGVEDRSAYVKNRKSFESVLKQRKQNLLFLKRLDSEIKKANIKYSSSAFKALIKQILNYEADHFNSVEAFSWLKQASRKYLKYDLENARYQRDWPMLVRFYKITKFEKFISSASSADEMSRLEPRKTKGAFSSGRIFKYLLGEKLLKPEIQTKLLAKEKDELLKDLLASQAHSPEEKEIAFLIQYKKIFSNFLLAQASAEDVSQVIKLSQGSNPLYFLFQSNRVLNLNLTLEEMTFAEHSSQLAWDFYHDARDRDVLMSQKVLEIVHREKFKKPVLISGGFHAEGMDRRLMNAGYQILRIEPRINLVSSTDDQKLYEANFLSAGPNIVKRATIESQWITDPSWQSYFPEGISKVSKAVDGILLRQKISPQRLSRIQERIWQLRAGQEPVEISRSKIRMESRIDDGGEPRGNHAQNAPWLHRYGFMAASLLSSGLYFLLELLWHSMSGNQSSLQQFFRLDSHELWMAIAAIAIFTLSGVIAQLFFNRWNAAQKEVQSSNDFYANLVEGIPQNIFRKDMNGKFTFGNRNFLKTLRLDSVEQLAGKTDHDFYPSAIADQYHQDDLRVLAGEKIDKEEIHRTQTGEIRYVHVIKTPIVDSHGKIVGLQGIFEDVTENKKARDELALFRAQIEQSSDALHILDPATGEILDFNHTFLETLGYSRDEAKELMIDDIDPAIKNGAVRFHDIAAEIRVKGRKVFQAEHRRKDGSVFPVEVVATYTKIGDREFFVCVARDITERKRAAEELRASRDFFHKLAQQIPGALYLFRMAPDGSFSIPFASEKFVKAFGIQPDAIYADASPIFNAVIPQDRAGLMNSIHQSAQTMEDWQFEFRVNFGGETHWLHAHSKPERQSDGTILWYGFVMDITERKSVEAALLHSEVKYRTVANNTYDWEYWRRPDGTFAYISPSSERVTGYTPEEFIRSPSLLSDMVHPEDRDSVLAHLAHTQSRDMDAHETEFRITTRGGEMRWISHACKPVFDDQGSYLGRRASNRDITERKRAEEELKRAKERLEMAQSASLMGTWDWDIERDQVEWTPGMFQLFGLDPSQHSATRETWLGAIHPEDRERAKGKMLELIQTRAQNLNHEYRIVLPNGSIRWVNAIGQVFFNPDGQPVRVLGISMDITERKKSEKLSVELAESRKTAVLAASIAHDLNNLLIPVLGNSEMIREDLKGLDQHIRDLLSQLRALPELSGNKPILVALNIFETAWQTFSRETFSNLEGTVQSAGGMKGRLGPMMVFAKLEHGTPEVFDLYAETQTLIISNQSQFGNRVTFYLEGASSPIFVEANKWAILNLITNLMVNGAQAIPESQTGSVGVKIDKVELTAVPAPLMPGSVIHRLIPDSFKPGTYVRLSVTDSGTGIPVEIFPQLFTPFFTTKSAKGGSGLGLPAVREIVGKNGGILDLQTQEGKGTTFVVYLPATDKQPEGQKRNGDLPTGNKELVWVLEDEKGVYESLLPMLRRLNYRVRHFIDDISMIDAANQPDEKPALILSDMKIEQNERAGVDAYKSMYPKLGRIPWIMMSGQVGAEIVREGQEFASRLGIINAFMSKPFTMSAIAIALSTALHQTSNQAQVSASLTGNASTPAPGAVPASSRVNQSEADDFAPRILVVEDEDTVRNILMRVIKRMFPNAIVITARNSEEIVAQLSDPTPITAIMLDQGIPGVPDMSIYSGRFFARPERPRIIVNSGAAPSLAMQAVSHGQLVKPYNSQQLITILKDQIQAWREEQGSRSELRDQSFSNSNFTNSDIQHLMNGPREGVVPWKYFGTDFYDTEVRAVEQAHLKSSDAFNSLSAMVDEQKEPVVIKVHLHDPSNQEAVAQVLETVSWFYERNSAFRTLLILDHEDQADFLRAKLNTFLSDRFGDDFGNIRKFNAGIQISLDRRKDSLPRIAKTVDIDWPHESYQNRVIYRAPSILRVFGNMAPDGSLIEFNLENQGYGASLLQAVTLLLRGGIESGLQPLSRSDIYVQSKASSMDRFSHLVSEIRALAQSA